LSLGKDFAQVGDKGGFGWEIPGGEETKASARDEGGLDREPQEGNGM